MHFKVYMEITNRCNLSCDFCPGTSRSPGMMSLKQFSDYAEKVCYQAEYLYFHLMGEPLLHPELPQMIKRTRDLGMKPIITTNGTLLARRGEEILQAGVHKVSISLHSFEANERTNFDSYLRTCLDFAKECCETDTFCALRLWNLAGGKQEQNAKVLDALHAAFPGNWKRNRSGSQLTRQVYLEWGNHFDWPDPAAPDLGEVCFCRGLRDQVGVLCDGRVVPCCLDRNGDLVLGDLNRQTLPEIFASERARAIYGGFSNRRAIEDLCRRCGFAHARFQKAGLPGGK